jgi:hypothetical protein
LPFTIIPHDHHHILSTAIPRPRLLLQLSQDNLRSWSNGIHEGSAGFNSQIADLGPALFNTDDLSQQESIINSAPQGTWDGIPDIQGGDFEVPRDALGDRGSLLLDE